MKKTTPLEKDNSIVESIIYKLEPDFVLALMSKFKTLTEDELMLCVLLRNNFSDEDISMYMEMKESEILKMSNRIQRKLSINKNINIKSYLKNYLKGIIK